jgi:hypothetical protein
MVEQQVDERLWRMAKKRADFKKSLTFYILINLFLWAIWWITQGRFYGINNWSAVWPVWPTLAWGLGIAFQYFDAYGDGDRQDAIEKEYQKLKQQQQR